VPEAWKRIVLVGFMGSGKSRVGAELARLLGWRFEDMDRRIEERLGGTVPEIFERRGEAFFRAEERRLAEELARLEKVVIAAGGGAFVSPETRQALQAGALTIWLRCDLETALARIPLDGSRPLARDRETITGLFGEREPSYRLADRAVNASSGNPGEVARAIVEILGAPETKNR
jgi:shikimate kinase